MDYIVLIHKYLAGTIMPEEAILLNSWKAESNENRVLFEEVARTWELSQNYQKGLRYHQQEELAKLLTRIDQDKVKKGQWLPNAVRRTPFLRYAASILVLLILIYIGKTFTSPEMELSEAMVTLASPKKSVLPDSSAVHLNKNSALRFSEPFNARIVHLSGEAFFEVKSDSDHPFLIHTKNVLIKVVGTSFSVRSRQDEDTVEVIVKTGIVKVITERDTMDLSAGLRCIVNTRHGVIAKMPNTDLNYLSWRTRKVQFKNTPLSDVFQELEEFYGVSIVANEADFLDCRFTGTFDNLDLSQALEILSFSLGVVFNQPDKNTVQVVEKCK